MQEHPGATVALAVEPVVRAFAVGGVADDRVMNVFQVPSELVATTVFRREFHESVAGRRVVVDRNRQFDGGESTQMCHGRLQRCVLERCRVVIECLERMVDRGGLRRPAAYEGNVTLLDPAGVEVRPDSAQGVGIESKEQHARGAAVDAVDGVDTPLQLVAQALDEWHADTPPGPVHDRAFGLGNRHEGLVPIEDLQGRIGAYCGRWPRTLRMSKKPPAAPSAFTRVRRVAELARYDRVVVHEILDAAPVAHVAHVIGERPVATPTFHWRVGERVYWHGSVASRMLRRHAEPGEVCLTATIMDGWVLARSAFNHTANYRSVLCFGRPSVVTDLDEKRSLLEQFMAHWFPGRWEQLRPVTKRELGATSIYSLPLDEASAKVRTGGAGDPPADVAWPVWAGVVPIVTRNGVPEPESGLLRTVKAPRVRPVGVAGTGRRKSKKRAT